MTVGIPLAVRETANPENPLALLYASVADACVLAVLRVYGQKTTADIEQQYGSQQQARLLAAISPNMLAKQATVTERCAQAQMIIDTSLGRAPSLQKDNEGRIWLQYKRAGHWLGNGLICPSASSAVLDKSVGQAWYRSRHGQTASVIGGTAVVFVHTHDMTAGDAFNAGYFADADNNNQLSYLWQPQDLPPLGELINGSTAEPVAESVAESVVNSRSIHTLETPLAALALRMTVLAEMLSIMGAVAITEHAWRIVLGAYWSWLPRALNLGDISHCHEAAQLYAGVVALNGTEVSVDINDDFVVVQHSRQCWQDHGVPRQIIDGMVRAWCAILPNFCWQLRAIVVSNNAQDLLTVRFDMLGPEG